MKAEIKSMFSIEIDQTLESYWPDIENDFGLSIRLLIGTKDNEASESFDIFVCSPAWLENNLKDNDFMWDRSVLILKTYDHPLIKAIIEKRVSACIGKNWEEIAVKLSQFSKWEFENYM